MPGPSFTEKQMPAVDLPGMHSAFPEVTADLVTQHDWQPVFNTTIVTMMKPLGSDVAIPYVLTAVRREETNLTHPNVVSSPTQRMVNLSLDLHDPARLATEEQIATLFNEERITTVAPAQLEGMLQQHSQVVAKGEPRPRQINEPSMLSAFARRILSTKLGVKDVEHFPGTVSLAQIAFGFANVVDTSKEVPPDDEHRYEPLAMFGSVIYVEDPSVFPRQTDEFRSISWTPLQNFSKNVQAQLAPALINLEQSKDAGMCVRGQCIVTSRNIIDDVPQLAAHCGVPPEQLDVKVDEALLKPIAAGAPDREALRSKPPERRDVKLDQLAGNILTYGIAGTPSKLSITFLDTSVRTPADKARLSAIVQGHLEEKGYKLTPCEGYGFATAMWQLEGTLDTRGMGKLMDDVQALASLKRGGMAKDGQ